MAKKKTVPSDSAAPSPTPAPAAPARARKASTRGAKADGIPRENSAPVEVASAPDLNSALPQPAQPTPSYEQIAEAAYHRFLQRGGNHGHEFDDWIEAERQLRGDA